MTRFVRYIAAQLAISGAALLPFAASAAAATAPIELEYLYNLSTTAGAIPFSGNRLSYDAFHKELFVVGDGVVRVFNEAGMEIGVLGDDTALGTIVSLAALENGDVAVITMRDGMPALFRCDYRGRPLASIPVTGLPDSFASGFSFNQVEYAKGHLYLVDAAGMKVAIVDLTGRQVAALDVAALLDVASKRQDFGISGFSVDATGKMLFTVPTLFKAFVLTPAGELSSFGRPGGAPGRFNVVSGMATDGHGHLFVIDTLKSAIITFDDRFEFIAEFGRRGQRRGGLFFPTSIAVGDAQVFVSQSGRKGVAVYRIKPL